MSAQTGARGGNLSVECRARGHTSAGRAYDLTREGCLLDLGNGFLLPGDAVSLRFASGVRLIGRVSLLHGRIARVAFEQPLHEAVLAHLRQAEPAVAAADERCFTRSQRIASAARKLG